MNSTDYFSLFCGCLTVLGELNPWRTHSCVQRAHSCVRDMFHCFLARFPLSRDPPKTVKHPGVAEIVWHGVYRSW
jgi:hypothetical protein